jgi:membrane associated rhomboid family serine protease
MGFIVEFGVKALMFAILVVSPCLCIFAYRTWTIRVRQNLSRWRNVLGVASIALMFLNWLAFVLVIILRRQYIDLETRAPTSFLVSVLAVVLAFALKKSPRIQVVAVGILWPQSGSWSSTCFPTASNVRLFLDGARMSARRHLWRTAGIMIGEEN